MGVTISFTSEASTEDLKAVRAFIDSYLGQPATVEAPAKAKPEPKAEPEPEPEEDLLGSSDEVDYASLRTEATTLATKFVSEGKTPAVKAALQANGNPGRVSKLEDSHLAGFIKALS